MAFWNTGTVAGGFVVVALCLVGCGTVTTPSEGHCAPVLPAAMLRP